MKTLKELLKHSEVLFFIFATLIVAIIVLLLDIFFDKSFALHDILVEAHGLIFDLIVLGVFLTAYNAYRNKKERIKRLIDEISDYRGWDEKEAVYRIVGNIRRLNTEGTTAINLNLLYLENAKLFEVNLSGSRLMKSNLANAVFYKAILKNTNFQGSVLTKAFLSYADLENSKFLGADLTNADLTSSNLKNANFSDCIIKGGLLALADLTNADFTGANLSGTIFIGANLTNANFTGANLSDCNFDKAILVGVNFTDTNQTNTLFQIND